MKISDSLFGFALASLAFTSACGGAAYSIPPVDAVVQPEPEDDLLGDLMGDDEATVEETPAEAPAAEAPATEAPAAEATPVKNEKK